MFRALTLFIALTVSLSFAQVISYTGYSPDSQKAAEDEAAAGVAKQISANVSAQTTVKRGETRVGSNTELTKDMQVKNMVKSDLFLKGLRIVDEPKKGNMYAATASIDLKELTSAARVRISQIKAAVADKERLSQQALSKNSFGEAIRLLDESEDAARPYQSYIDEIAVYMPIDESMVLKTNTADIRAKIVNGLRGISLDVPESVGSVDGDSPLVFSVTVTKSGKPVSGFPVIAEHGGKRLAEAFSDAKGVVNFRIPAMVLQNSPFMVKVIPGVAMQYRKEAGISETSTSYKMDKKQCKIRFECSESASICGAVTRKLAQKLGSIVESADGMPLNVDFDVELKHSVKSLNTYDVSMTLFQDDFSCNVAATGVGKNESDAIRIAVSKMNLNDCMGLEDLCSK